MIDKGVYVKFKKARNITDRFKLLDDIIANAINPEVNAFSSYAEKQIYENIVKQSFSNTKLKEIERSMNYVLNDRLDKINNEVEKMMSNYIYSLDIDDKHARALVNYTANNLSSDYLTVLNSIASQTNKALNLVSFTVNNIARQDLNLLYSEIQRVGDIQKNYSAFIDVFKNDYSQRYALEISKNPLLNNIITQKDNIYTININGRNYDLDKYLTNKGKQQALDVVRQTETIRSIENNSTIYQFIRIEPAKEPREHSEYEGEYFSNDPSIIGTEYKGNIILNGNTITDFKLGEQAPYGCGHIYLPI